MKTHVVLRRYFDRKKISAPGFSLRALAARLGVSAPFLSRILNGKKPVPAVLLPRLAQALDIEPELLKSLAPKREGAEATERASPAMTEWILPETGAMRILRNWYYIPILELTTLKNFDGSAESISRRLRIGLAATEVALRELASLNLVECVDGKYRKTNEKIRFASAKSVPLIRKFHEDMLERGRVELREGLSEEEFRRRLIVGITVSATPEKVQEVKTKLAAFLYEIANELTAAPGTEVYHLAAQLFPLTKDPA